LFDEVRTTRRDEIQNNITKQTHRPIFEVSFVIGHEQLHLPGTKRKCPFVLELGFAGTIE
jgi:hypothetical protein